MADAPTRRGRPRIPDVEAKARAAARALVEEIGYDRTTIDAVADRAGVARTAIYRRWPNKATLIYDAVLMAGPEQQVIPDSGDVRADLLAVIRQNAHPMRDPRTNALITRLVAEAAADLALAEALRSRYFEPRARLIAERVRLAVERGEVTTKVDVDLLPALLTGPLQYLALVHGSRLGDAELERIVDAIVGPHIVTAPA